jgi:hypothetical protein
MNESLTSSEKKGLEEPIKWIWYNVLELKNIISEGPGLAKWRMTVFPWI